jgi:hypothetical protein
MDICSHPFQLRPWHTPIRHGPAAPGKKLAAQVSGDEHQPFKAPVVL